MSTSSIPALPSNPSEDEGPKVIAITVCFNILSTVLIALRMYVRRFIRGALGWDDLLMVIAMVANFACTGLIIMVVKNGGGRHIGDLGLEMYGHGLYYTFIATSMLVVPQIFTKASIGVTILRIAVQRPYRIATIANIIFMLIVSTGTLIFFNVACEDIRSNWDISIVSKCISQSLKTKITYVVCSFNIFIDLAFAIFIPFPMVWQLQLNKRTKASAMFVLSFGVVACAASICRMKYLINFGSKGDYLWDVVPICIWTVVETNTAMMAGCMPALRPLFKSILDTTILQRLTKANSSRGTAGSMDKYSNATYPNAKNFTHISENLDRVDSDSISQQSLIHNKDTVPLGSIQKTTTSTIHQVDSDMNHSAEKPDPRRMWAMGHNHR